ncbi:MAG: hypothetical protein U0903_06980 [Planctomycetales bacterium]
MGTPRKKSIRPGGKRYRVFNEGLCVYLHDAGNTVPLRSLIEQQGLTTNYFLDNLAHPEFSRAVRENSSAIAYRLAQDEDIEVEIVVGPTLTDKELESAYWLPAQFARLSLPTGQLRIDSPNTLPLDPVIKHDPPAIAHVPPGDYRVTLYRLDAAACERLRRKHPGVDEVIVLTPLNPAKPPPETPLILEIPDPVDHRKWIHQYSITPPTFECQVNFFSNWEQFRTNLDSAAVNQLSLESGSWFKLQAAKLTFQVLCLDEEAPQDFVKRIGREKIDAMFADHQEGVLASWREFDGETILWCFRYKAATAIATKYHDTWTSATGEVTSD